MHFRHLSPVLLISLLAALPLVAEDDLKDVPDVAKDEILRRGAFVERTGGYRNDVTDLIAEALKPPADDSYKWFISVITTPNCNYCEALKRDFASSPYLKSFVDTEDHKRSWAHYNVYSTADRTQNWRWDRIRVASYPTVIIQPPRDGRYGDPKTVVLQKTGYDGDSQKMAHAIRSGIMQYVARLTPRQGGIGQTTVEQESRSYEPPFSPPPRVEPTPYTPPQFPFDYPPMPQPVPQPMINPLSLLTSLIGSMLGSGGLTNVLLLVLAGFAGIRTFRKVTGQKLLLDDIAYQNIVDTIKNLVGPTTPRNPGT